jgi:large subunit ribosomal protein L5
MVPRLKEKYLQEVRPALQQRFGYRNPMEIPRLVKIVLNLRVG